MKGLVISLFLLISIAAAAFGQEASTIQKAPLSQAEIELSSMQEAAAPPIKELLDHGGCT